VADIALLLLACAGLAAAAGLTTLLLRPDSVLDGAVSFGVVAAAGVVATTVAVGAPGLLTRAAVLAVEAAWALAAAALLARRGERFRWPRFSLPAVRTHPWASALVALAAVALAWQLLVALVLPPFAFDALGYHLVLAASWVQGESLDPAALSLCCARYPGNSELMFAWPMLFEGSDAAVGLVQMGFAVLGAVSVAGIVRSAGLSAAAAAAAAALFVVTPIVLTQAPTEYADVFVAACVLGGLHALIRYAATGAWQRLVVAGLAAGLLLGTKGTGIIWAAAFALTALALAIGLARRGRMPGRVASGGFVAFTVACLALGSFWYARNWIETGNPVYPFEVDVAGVQVFEGPERFEDRLTQPPVGADQPRPVAIVRSWGADVRFWNHGSYDYQEQYGGLGPLWPWLALPLLVPVSAALIRRRSPSLIAVAVVVAVFVVQPYSWWSRFTIQLMGIGALAIVAAASWAPRTWMRRAVELSALALALAGVGLSSHEVAPASRADPLPAQDVVDLIGAPAEERTIGRLFFPEYRFLEEVPADATIAVDRGAAVLRWNYPLFGSELTRTVLPAETGPLPAAAWVVTAPGRPLDRQLRADPRFSLAIDERGVHVWQPV
jgi:Dolichyl-phosphate-mannose-protein mannosyltransferase